MKINNSDVLIFSLSNSKQIAQKIANHLNVELQPIRIDKFADGEMIVSPKIPVRGKRVVLIQSTSKPVNDSLMELLIAIDSMKRASAKAINVIIPYYGYARQDRKAKPREPITSRLVAKMIESAGATNVLTWDIHSLQTQGFFDISFDSLEAVWILMKKYVENFQDTSNVAIVSPDYGCVKRAREIAMATGAGLAIVDKRRSGKNEVEINNVLGEVAGLDCVIVDDMIDTGGTILGAAKIVKERGSKSITILATHGLFNNNAVEKFKEALANKIIDKVIISDTIEQKEIFDGLEIVSVSEAIAKCISIYATGNGSMSFVHDENSQALFTKKPKYKVFNN